MVELLDALGVRHSLPRIVTAVAMWLAFAGAMCALAAGQARSESWLGAGTVTTTLWVVGLWAAWTVWHSVVFAWNRQRYMRTSRHAYRRAFLLDIFPGVTIGFSQMLRPALNGSTFREGIFSLRPPDEPIEMLAVSVGLVVFSAAFLLFVSAFQTLGAGKVGFVAEFVHTDEFTPVRRGPYARIRHPLFWSGVGASCALALFTRTGTAFAVAGVNFLYGFVYNKLEDRRLRLVFGSRYSDYAQEIPRILPAQIGKAVLGAAFHPVSAQPIGPHPSNLADATTVGARAGLPVTGARLSD